MDWSIAPATSGKAAAASVRAKRACLVACVLVATSFYVSEEKNHAGATPGPQREVKDLMAHFAVKFDDAASVNLRKVFYDKQDGVYCGEVNGHSDRGGDVKLKDGVRIFVCGPGVRARPNG